MPEPDQRAVVVIDYQNIHLTGRDMFARGTRAGDCVIDPAAFALRAIAERNALHSNQPPLSLSRVRVFRGEPIAHIQGTLARAAQRQKARWEREPHTEVEYRPLRYGTANRHGKRTGEEKGIDVLCALEVVRGALDDECDVVLVASHDTDLIPALDFAVEVGQPVETVGWVGAKILADASNATRDTRLTADDFHDVRDTYAHYFDAP